MERLKKFQLINEEIKKISGGRVPHTATEKKTPMPGSLCYYLTTDDFDDKNCNGKWDDDENGSTQNPILVC